MTKSTDARLYPTIFLTALGTLIYEISLIRVLSYTIWYHFAYVVLSAGLLGLGAAGAWIAARPPTAPLELIASRALWGASVATVAVLAFVSRVALNPLLVFERPSELATLIGYQVAAVLPFFLSGIAITLMLRHAARRVHRLYFWDLAGAALGCAVTIFLMDAIAPPGAVVIAAGCFSAAAATLTAGRARWLSAGLAGLCVVGSLFAVQLPFVTARSKDYARYINSRGGEPVSMKWTGLFRTDVLRATERTIESPLDNWGLSKVAKTPQPMWGLVLHDGTAGTPIYDLRAGDVAFLEDHVIALPYLVAPPRPEVLIIGVGGGRDVFAAVRNGAKSVLGVELDRSTVDFVNEDPLGVYKGFFSRPEVTVITGEGRSVVRRSQKKYDLIKLTAVDTLAATSSGAYVLAENYLYTVEAIHDYLDHLTQDGLLSIGIGIYTPDPPASAGRLTSVVQEALRQRGIDQPDQHAILVNSRSLIAEMMVSVRPFTQEQVSRLYRETERLDYERLILGGSGHPDHLALLNTKGSSARERLYDRIQLDMTPTTDDRPFFFSLYRWQDLLAGDKDAYHTSALGQLVLLALLGSLTLLAVACICGPLLVLRRRRIPVSAGSMTSVLGYFLALGLGFMLFEVSLLQRFTLYLGYPTYSLTVVLFSLLVCLGLGSLLSERLVGRERTVLPVAWAAIAVLAAFYTWGLPVVQDATLQLPLLIRVGITFVMLAPLGLTLGTFFPLGIRKAEALHPDLVAWAWAINGCASVTATVLSVVLAMQWGFSRVWILALLIYAGGIYSLLRLDGSKALLSSESRDKVALA